MPAELRDRLVDLVRPLHQDLDGLSHFDETLRTASLARHFFRGTSEAARHFELMLLFQRLGPWLLKVGNMSRALLVTRREIEEIDLRRVAQSLSRLDQPRSEAEIALATALLVESFNTRALVERFTRARRDGLTIRGVAEEIVSTSPPDWPWLTDEARQLIRSKLDRQQNFCRDLLEE